MSARDPLAAPPSALRAALGARGVLVGGALTGAFAALALLSFLWTPHDVEALAIAARLQGPSAAHWCGTDQFGRDVFSMVMVGARTSLAVAVVAVGIGVGLGAPLGLAAAAAHGGLLDEAVMRANDLVFVHAGIEHNFINTGDRPLRLYTLYAPPEHDAGTRHATKQEADAAEHDH